LGGELNEKQSKYIKIINKNSVELAYFLEKLLEFSLVESTVFNFDYRTFDIVNLVQNAIKTTTLNADNPGIVIDTEELEKKVVHSDENALKMIVQNLIDTMFKMSETGMINVKLTNSTDEEETIEKCQITVSGVGIGISEMEKKDLFNPYALLEKSNKKGLLRSVSLATVEAIVKKLGGSVWIETGAAYGTAFNVSFPCGVKG
jgi:K+-sensing histidine kinase KdpD